MSNPDPLHDPTEVTRPEDVYDGEEAQITLSRKTLERLEYAYSDLTRDELTQVREILKGMRLNDGASRVVKIGRDENGDLIYLP